MLALTFGMQMKGLVGYVDADGTTQEHQCMITGFTFLINGGVILWGSKKQELVTLSIAKSKYVAATHTAKEALWLHQLIGEMFQPLSRPMTLYSDNQSAIVLTCDDSYHTHTKHTDICYHFIHFSVENGSISFPYCPLTNMIADTLTKALPSIKAKYFAFELGLHLSV